MDPIRCFSCNKIMKSPNEKRNGICKKHEKRR